MKQEIKEKIFKKAKANLENVKKNIIFYLDEVKSKIKKGRAELMKTYEN